jgi:hypothetical protein
MLPEREFQRLTPESGVCLEGTTTIVRMSYGLAESALLTEDTVLRLNLSDTDGIRIGGF